MALNIDTTRRPMRPSDWAAIAEAVLGADPTDETDWIEWKGPLDLTKAEAKFNIARAVLAFANRNPNRAARNLEGHALLLVGVEPGQVHGVEVLDPSDLEQRLSVYLGPDGPEWECQYPRLNGKSVLVICVRPPCPGDAIYTLRKTFGNCDDGTVFIRRGSKSTPASSEELMMLQQRLLGWRRLTGIDGLIAVEWSSDGNSLELLCHDLADADVRRILDARRRQLIHSASASVDQTTVPDVSVLMRQLPQRRTALTQYKAKVDQYLPRYEQWLRDWIVRLLAANAPPLAVRVRNRSNSNLAKVEVNVRIPVPLTIEERPFEEVLSDSPPEPPERPSLGFGASRLHLERIRMPAMSTTRLVSESVDIDVSDDSTRIRYYPVHLRPQAEADLPVLGAIARRSVAPRGLIDVEWSATGTSHDGEASGKLVLTPSESTQPPPYDQLMAFLELADEEEDP